MKEHSIASLDLTKCYGCTACVHSCPKEAIVFQPDKEGFYYPTVIEDKCIDCSICLKVCAITDNHVNTIVNNEKQEVYAAWNKKNEEVLKSTSGGCFYTIASDFIKKKGVVYGVVWNEQMVATHQRITDESGLQRSRGSKYVQSYLGDTFLEIKKDLKEENRVLFIGTPCQVGGLKSYLRKEYKNLYTIDLICHGTPSPKMFEAYLKYVEEKGKNKVVNFECRGKKKTGWRAYETIYFANGRKTQQTAGLKPYLYGFYEGFFNRESCYMCSYSIKKRPGDITLSDFWGAERAHNELIDKRKYGFNFLSCNTSKGEELFTNVEQDLNTVISTLEIAAAGDPRFTKSDKRPTMRNNIYDLLEQKGFEYLAENVLRPKFLFVRNHIPDFLKNLIMELKTYRK